MRKLLPIIVLVALVILAVGVVTFISAVRTPTVREAQRLKIHFVDVGQGDCILLQTPDGRNVLVDAGSEASADEVLSYLVRNGLGRIDVLVITHPHSDHVGGLPKILERFGVSKVVDPGYPCESQVYKDALSIIESRRIDYKLAAKCRTLHIGRDVDLEILWPPDDYSPEGESGLDNGSVVMRVEYGDVSLLLTGDIEREAEGRLLAARQDFRCTVLKVACHGGGDSTSNEFVQVARPDYAVISAAADDASGRPADAVLKRLKAAGARIFRTDENGTIVFTTDGRKVQVAAER